MLDRLVVLLVIASMVTLSLETMALAPDVMFWVVMIDRAILAAFALEWFVRLFVRRDVYTVTDLASWAPEAALLALFGSDYAFLRLFRLLRVLRLLRALPGVSRFGRAVWEVRQQLVAIKVIAAIILFCCASLYWVFEPAVSSIPDGLYLAVITATSVGYGDLTPITAQGRMVSAALSLLGIGIVAAPAAIISSALVAAVPSHTEPE